MPHSKRRILTIDGGGIKGAFPASFLAEIETALGLESAGSYFDLIAGTSTGGIIALALGLGFTARAAASFYREFGPSLFPVEDLQHAIKSLPRRILSSKYSHDTLRGALENLIGEKTLSDSRARLVIPAFNVESGDVYVFRTPHHERLMRDRQVRAVDVALATASAPTFYPAHRLNNEIPLVDGAVWANNPIALAVAEAVGTLGWAPEAIEVLSIGCTKWPYAAGWARNKAPGVAYWAWNAADLIMSSQSSGSENVAATLIGHNRILRINPTVPHRRYGLDKSAEIDSLVGLGKLEVPRHLPALRDLFFDSPAEPFSGDGAG